MKRSWSESRSQSLLYDEPFLRSAFQYPGSSFELSPALYIDGSLAAFVAGFPRNVILDGRPLRLLCITFWTTAAEFKGKGYGARIWMEILRRARENGYDGAVNFCVDGEISNEIVLNCGTRAGAQVSLISRVKYLAQLIRPVVVREAPSNLDTVDIFLRAASRIPATVNLLRVWSREEAEWQCIRRWNALSSAHVKTARCGIVTGYLTEFAGDAAAKALIVDDLLWSDLENEERVPMMKNLLAQGADQGAQIAVVPLLGYADTDALRTAGFRQSRRLMNLYLTLWGSVPLPQNLTSIYLDVY
ncbi:MAG: GNAT family N-acetyltransferase [Terracidiphilus sp.]